MRFVKSSRLIALALLMSVAATSRPAHADYLDVKTYHSEAVKLAREGKTDAALRILRTLHQQAPDDLNVTRETLLVSGWAGLNADVIHLYESMPNVPQPDFVLEAVGRAYRDMSWTNEAIKIYRQGRAQSPYNANFVAGEVRSAVDSGNQETAAQMAEDDLRAHGDRVEVLLAAAYAATAQKKTADAVRYCKRALQADPSNHDAQRDMILALQADDAPEEALQLVGQYRRVVTAEEYRRLLADRAAKLVRIGTNEPDTKERRYATVDRAIAEEDRLLSHWSGKRVATTKEVNRLRFDHMVALRDRTRMKEVIAEYEKLQQEGVDIPPYVMRAVGDAYLALREPQKSRDAYLAVLKSDPKNYGARKQLFYAYNEMSDYDNAFKTIDALAEETAPAGNREAAAQRETAATIAGLARLYAGMPREAEKRLAPIIDSPPNTPYKRELRGNLDMAHGHPRKAKEEYLSGLQMANGQNRDNEVGLANSALALQNLAESDALVDSLTKRFPDNSNVQRLARDSKVRKMAELQAYGEYGQPIGTGSVNPTRALFIGGKFFSPLIHNKWRVFVGTQYANQKEPGNEGSISLSRSALGVEYRNGDWVVRGAPTFSAFHDESRLGFEADVTRTLNDYWTVALAGEKESNATPLRAMNQGVTADSINASATWKKDETRSVRVGAHIMPFSDDNLRTGADVDFMQQLHVIPKFRLEGLASLGLEQNSADSNRFYYNPSSDFIALAGGRAVHTLYQRYATLWQHNLHVMAGVNWEDHYGSAPVLQARYEHRLFLNDTANIGANARFLHRSYDGAAEDDIAVGFDLALRFQP